MFARSVSMLFKPDASLTEFIQIIEKEVILLLRKQKGFQDEITFIVPGGTEVVGLSLWDDREKPEPITAEESGSAEDAG